MARLGEESIDKATLLESVQSDKETISRSGGGVWLNGKLQFCVSLLERSAFEYVVEHQGWHISTPQPFVNETVWHIPDNCFCSLQSFETEQRTENQNWWVRDEIYNDGMNFLIENVFDISFVLWSKTTHAATKNNNIFYKDLRHRVRR